jgi:hypothetical protein
MQELQRKEYERKASNADKIFESTFMEQTVRRKGDL